MLVTALIATVGIGSASGEPFEATLGVRFLRDPEPAAVPEVVRSSAIHHLGVEQDSIGELVFARGVLQDDHSFGLPASTSRTWAAARKAPASPLAGGALSRWVAFFREDGRLLVAIACWDDWRELDRVLYPCSEGETPDLLVDRDSAWLKKLRSLDLAAETWKVRLSERPPRHTLRQITPAVDRALNAPGPCHERHAVAVRPRSVLDGSGVDQVRWIAHVVSLMNLSAVLSSPVDSDGVLDFADGLDLGSYDWQLGYLVDPCPGETGGN